MEYVFEPYYILLKLMPFLPFIYRVFSLIAVMDFLLNAIILKHITYLVHFSPMIDEMSLCVAVASCSMIYRG